MDRRRASVSRTLLAGAFAVALVLTGCEVFDTPEQLHQRSERESAPRKAEEIGRARARSALGTSGKNAPKTRDELE